MNNILISNSVVLETTSYCNLHCPQCPRFDQNGFLDKHLNPTHLDFERFSKNFNLSQLPNLKEALFEGDFGDCMMHPKIIDFINFFKDLNLITLITNGSIRSESFYRNLAKIKNLKIIFSIDGFEDTNHLYRINSDYNKIMKNVRAFIDAGGQAIWKYIVFKHNQHQVERAVNEYKTLGFSDLIIQHTERSWFQGLEWDVKINGESLGYKLEPSDNVNKAKPLASKGALQEIDLNPININCSWKKDKQFYVNATGNILPCCMINGPSWQTPISSQLFKQLVGDNSINIYNNSILEIANGEFYTNNLKESWKKYNTAFYSCIANCNCS